ncbi:MAG: radical SAM protein [bacterium]|nr:radical SAM protein [bacterium]
MAYETALFKKLLHFKAPAYLIFHVTYRCNSKCSFCFNWKLLNRPEHNKEMSLNDIEKLARNFPYLMQLTLSGGEPTLRDDLPDICYLFIRFSKVNIITIPTNGLNPGRTLKILKNICRRLEKTHLRIVLTINGPESLHDNLSGVPGAFQQVMKTFKGLVSLRQEYNNITIDVVTVLTKINCSFIPEIAGFVRNHLDINTHTLILVRGDIPNPEYKEIAPKTYLSCSKIINNTYKSNPNKPFSGILKVISELNTDIVYRTITSNHAQLPCLAGKKLIVVNPEGIVMPCEYLNKPFGDLKKTNFDLKKIINCSQVKEILKHIQKSGCYCHWECSTQANIFYNPAVWPKIIWKYLMETL